MKHFLNKKYVLIIVGAFVILLLISTYILIHNGVLNKTNSSNIQQSFEISVISKSATSQNIAQVSTDHTVISNTIIYLAVFNPTNTNTYVGTSTFELHMQNGTVIQPSGLNVNSETDYLYLPSHETSYVTLSFQTYIDFTNTYLTANINNNIYNVQL